MDRLKVDVTGIDQVRCAIAVRGAKARYDDAQIRLREQVLGPGAFQACVGREPEGHGGGNASQVVDVPAWFGAATEVPAEPQVSAGAGSEAAGAPRAADIDVAPAGERMVTECADGARRRRSKIKAQAVGAVRPGQGLRKFGDQAVNWRFQSLPPSQVRTRPSPMAKLPATSMR